MRTDGEASNPGPSHQATQLVAASANVTSMKTQMENILSIPADILGCSEVRLPEPGQIEIANDLFDKGWNVVFGKALSRKQGSNRIPPGGVAIMAKAGLNLNSVPATCPDGQWLWQTTRFCHGVVRVSIGIVHIISVYGHTNAWNNRAQRDKNEEFLIRLARYIASLGDVPLLLLGDFNTSPDHSAVLPAEIGQGRLFDMAAVFACAQGIDPPNTCHVHQTSAGSRIDLVLANHVLVGCCQGCQLFHDSGLPTHTPVLVTLATEGVAQRGTCFRSPLAFPLNFQDPDGEAERFQSQECAGEIVARHAQGLSQAISQQDTETAFRVTCAAAEEYLCMRHFGQRYVRAYCGRGLAEMKQKNIAAPFLDKTQHCAVSSRCHRLMKLARRLEELSRKVQNRFVLAPIPQEWWNLWEAIRRDGTCLMPHAPAWLDPCIPDLPLLLALGKAARDHSTHERAVEGSRRKETKTAIFKEDWSNQRKLSHAFCRGEKPPVPPLLRRCDGSFTGNLVEIDGLLRDAWLPIFRLYGDSSPPRFSASKSVLGPFFPLTKISSLVATQLIT